MAAALLLVLVLTAAEAKPKAKELAPDPLPSAQVEVLINGSRPEDVLSPKSDFGPIVQNASKLGEFGYAKHPKHVLDWSDLRGVIKGRKCSTEQADTQCGDLVCRKGLCAHCTEDSECPSLHQCALSMSGGKTCRATGRKAWESAWLDSSEKFCTLLILVSSALAAASGTGGGSIFVPVLISFSYLQESAVVALSQFMILVGSIVNLSVFLARRHPDFPELPVIDYDCIVVLIPMLCLGVTLGVLVNRTSPSWLLLTLLCSTLCLALWRTGSKGLKQLKQERELLAHRPAAEDDVPQQGPEVVMSYGEVMKELVQAKSEQIAGIAIVWLVMLGASLHGLPYCSINYGLFLCVLAALLTTFALVMTWRFQATSYLNPIDWLNGGGKDRHPMTFPMVAFGTGFLGAMLGLGGGILLSPVLIEVGMHSEAVQATVASFVFLSSSLATIQYFMMGQIVWHYALWYGVVAVLATYLGQTACEVFIRKRRRYSFITLSVTTVLALSLFCLCVVGTKTVLHDYDMGKTVWFSFTRLCQSGRGTIIRPSVAVAQDDRPQATASIG
eukprot:CAMPEP_0181433842 /NCGR_PEP_ID=MMETSP1110-20121109/19509_1 /TAXON_ID=174948 /ORGANISM="Symbiodinium sp., Strain CCMP421" /LENGTH=556 /DNA_ID=CAMNT_0023557325 /DNA_START=103 /DNA_END=1770 /DNA_ORIENTATION=-